MNIATRLSSSALSKSVAASTLARRGKSHVAAAAAAQEPSDFPKKGSRRIPLEERKAMVEYYVNKYRAVNSGKFPPFSEVYRQVGGTYSVVRKLMKELQISSMSTVETQGEDSKDGQRVSATHHLFTSNMTINKNIYHDGQTTETRNGNLSSKEAGKKTTVKLPSVVTVQEENPIQRDTQTPPETESAKNGELLHEVEKELFQSESDKKIASNSCESAVGSDFLKATKNDESLHEVKEIRFFQSESDVPIANNSCESATRNLCSDPPKAINAQFIKKAPSEKMETLSSNGDTTQVENVINDKLKAPEIQQLHKYKDNAKMQDSELDKLELEPEPRQRHPKQKLGTVTRDLQKLLADDAEVAKKSNMWDDLKSYADGIFNFFKKQ